MPEPQPAHTLVASFATLRDASEVVADVTRAGLTPSLLEILDRTTVQAVDQMSHMGLGEEVAALLLIQCDDQHAGELPTRIEDTCQQSGAVDVARSSDPAEAALLLEARRLALPALERPGDWLLDDVTVPRSRIVDLMAAVEVISQRLAVVIGVFGHAGDGNLQPTFIFDDADPQSRAAALAAFDEMTRKTLELGGTINGEHGVGRLKRASSRACQLARGFDPAARAVHAAIESARPAWSPQPRRSAGDAPKPAHGNHRVSNRDCASGRACLAGPMIFITAKFRVRPEDAERWPEITREFTEATRAEEGCLWFDWSRSLDDPTEYVLVEAFRDGEAGGVHVGSQHFKDAQQTLPPRLVETPRIVNFEVPGTEWSKLGELAVG